MGENDPANGPLPADTLVGIAFRCALVCVRPMPCEAHCAASCRLSELVLSRALPPRLIGEFTGWALAIQASAVRTVSLHPVDRKDLCGDERLAAALVAACQYQECPALCMCAATLLGSQNIGRTLSATRTVAETLRASKFMLMADETASKAIYVH